MTGWTLDLDAIVAAATLLAVGVAIWQLRSSRRVACEDFARQLWLDYLKTGLDHPEFGETRCALAAFPGMTPKDLIDGNHECSQRYLWFLTVLLDTCENVLRYLPRRDWEPTLIEQLRFHRPALKEFWDEECRFYSGALDKLVRKALVAPEPYDELKPIILDSDRQAEARGADVLANQTRPRPRRRRSS